MKETLNGDAYFAEWKALPSFGAWGGEFNEWGTVWDTISYTDSGFTSDWFAQDSGLDVPGVDFEMAYNHVTFDNHYPGLAQRMNMYHVRAVRDVVAAFMDHADAEMAFAIDAQGTRTAWLENPVVVTNDGALSVDGWAADNDADDAYDTAHRTFRAAADDYWRDLRDAITNGVLDPLAPADLAAGALGGYDALAIAGSAWRTIESDAAAIAAVRSFVEEGGHVLLTDEGLAALVALGAAPEGSVDVFDAYAGHANLVARDDPLVAGVRGIARQTFEPVPLGFSIEDGSAPVFFVAADVFDGDVVGVGGTGQAAGPDPTKVVLGRAALGTGSIAFLGALLPDPSEAFYHPYGVDSYATTYTGDQIVRNALGWTTSISTVPLTAESAVRTNGRDALAVPDVGADSGAPTPGPAAIAVAAVALAAGLALRRRR